MGMVASTAIRTLSLPSVPRRAAAGLRPSALPVAGRVIDLHADPDGGLHLLAIVASDSAGAAVYGYRAPGTTQWEIHADLPGPAPQHAALALLQSGGTRDAVRVARARQPGAASRAVSTAGQWQHQALETNRYFPNESIVATSLVAAARTGGDLIAAAWSQIPGPGHARGGVFAASAWMVAPPGAARRSSPCTTPMAASTPWPASIPRWCTTPARICSLPAGMKTTSPNAAPAVGAVTARLFPAAASQAISVALCAHAREYAQPRSRARRVGALMAGCTAPRTAPTTGCCCLSCATASIRLLAKPLRLSFLFAEGVS